MEIILKNVRLSFPVLFTPEAFQDSAPRWSANFLFPKNGDVHQEVLAAMKKVAAEKWLKKSDGIFETLIKKDKTCLHDGDDKASKYDGYADNVFLSAVRQQKDGRLVLVDRQRAPISEQDGILYSGCYVNAKVDLWAQDNQYGQRINATLMVVQFVKDGDSFGGAKKPVADDMPDLGVDEDADISNAL